MKYISNAKMNTTVESGTIYKMKHGVIDITVHRIIGCGDTLYLSSNCVGISDRKLDSTSIINAINEAESIVSKRIDRMKTDINNVCISNVEISRY